MVLGQTSVVVSDLCCFVCGDDGGGSGGGGAAAAASDSGGGTHRAAAWQLQRERNDALHRIRPILRRDETGKRCCCCRAAVAHRVGPKYW